MISVLDEHEYAEKILQEGFVSRKHGLELFILAKYNRFILCLNKKDNKIRLVDFLRTQLSNYDTSDYYKLVNSAIRNAYKDNAVLLEINNILVTQNELDYINSLDIEYNCKRLLFTLMCLGKINCMAGFVNNFIKTTNSFKDVKDFGNFNNGFKITPLLTTLYQKEIIYVAQRGGLVLTFLDNIMPDENIIIIDDPTTIGYWFDKYNGDKNISNCENCGKLIKKKSNNQKMCSDCKEVAKKEQTRLRVKKFRNKMVGNALEKHEEVQ